MKNKAEPKYLKIEDGIPLPTNIPSGSPASPAGIAMRALKPGQSVLTEQTLKTAVGMAYRLIGAGNYKAASEGNGSRIWRVK